MAPRLEIGPGPRAGDQVEGVQFQPGAYRWVPVVMDGVKARGFGEVRGWVGCPGPLLVYGIRSSVHAFRKNSRFMKRRARKVNLS